jgi:plasmid stabilization system protein ParE
MAKQIVWPKEAINDENTREIFIGDYRLLYRIEGKQISIIAVVHGSSDLRKILQKKNK